MSLARTGHWARNGVREKSRHGIGRMERFEFVASTKYTSESGGRPGKGKVPEPLRASALRPRPQRAESGHSLFTSQASSQHSRDKPRRDPQALAVSGRLHLWLVGNRAATLQASLHEELVPSAAAAALRVRRVDDRPKTQTGS